MLFFILRTDVYMQKILVFRKFVAPDISKLFKRKQCKKGQSTKIQNHLPHTFSKFWGTKNKLVYCERCLDAI